MVTKIVDSIKDSTPIGDCGGFIRKNPDSDRWFEVGDKIAREKVGHALRYDVYLYLQLVFWPRKQTHILFLRR